MTGALGDTFAFAMSIVIAMSDGRKALLIASVAAMLALLGPVGAVGGTSAVLIVASLTAAAVIAQFLGRGWHTLGFGSAGSATVPSTADALFGPRSVRMAAVVITLIAASWISYNVGVTGGGYGGGLLFIVADIALTGGFRLILARTEVDLAVGSLVVLLSGTAGVIVEYGMQDARLAVALGAWSVVVGACGGWILARTRPSRGDP